MITFTRLSGSVFALRSVITVDPSSAVAEPPAPRLGTTGHKVALDPTLLLGAPAIWAAAVDGTLSPDVAARVGICLLAAWAALSVAASLRERGVRTACRRPRGAGDRVSGRGSAPG